MEMIKHYQSTQSNMFAMFLQHLWKEVMDGVYFGVHQDQNFYKLDCRFLMKVARHVQSNQKRKLLNFCNILRKSIATAFVFHCDAKHSDTLLGSNHFCCYLFSGACGQNWAWPFGSWNSEICCNSKEWIDKMSWFFSMLIHI